MTRRDSRMNERPPFVSWLDRPITPHVPKRKPGRPRKVQADGGVPKPPSPPPRPQPPPPPEPPPRPAAKHRGRPKKDREATSADIVKWIQERCYVPEGRKFGQLFELADWQIEALEAIYDNPHGPTRRAILSFGRKNGKTTFAALLLLVHLCGPKYRYNSQLFSAAQSREQAGLIFNMAAKIVRMSPGLRGSVIVRESSKELRCLELGTKYRALAAEATTAYGLSPCFVIFDELGQICPRKQIKRLQNTGFQTAA